MTQRPARPAIIGHRGASGYRPEHTLASYELAARMGADFLEPDLVSTADGVLVARHENEIADTTDVAGRPEFASRRTTREVDGREVTGWFTEDFTLAELRTLRARERIPHLRPANTVHDGRHAIPTLQEVIDLAARLTGELGRPIGIYPETKHPSHFRALGLALEPPLVRALRDNGLDAPDAPVFVQSFEVGNLRALRGELSAPLVQLLGAGARRPRDLELAGDARTYADMATPEGLREIAAYADAVGPAKEHVTAEFVASAHSAGLLVHPFTFRRENAFLPKDLRSGRGRAAVGDLVTEIRRHLDAGVDGFFTDNPDLGLLARDGRRQATIRSHGGVQRPGGGRAPRA